MLTNGALLNEVTELTNRDIFLRKVYVVLLVLCFLIT